MNWSHFARAAGPALPAAVLVVGWLAALVAVASTVPIGDQWRGPLLAGITLGAIVLGVVVLPLAPGDALLLLAASRTRRRRMRALRRGRCPRCDYDVRASRPICPECGSRRPSAVFSRRSD